MRTTLDLEKPVLDGLKRLQKQEKTTLGKLASRLLSEAMSHREGRARSETKPLTWVAADLGATIDLADKEALYRTMEAGD
jgi:predicted DNA-binding ribbon-helix-helix protein